MEGWITNRHKDLMAVIDRFIILTVVIVSQLYTYVKTHDSRPWPDSSVACNIVPIHQGCPLRAHTRVHQWIYEWVEWQIDVSLSLSQINKQKNFKLTLADVASGLSPGLWTKGSPVRFPIRAHDWVAGQVRSPVGGAWEATTHWCFSPFLPPFPSV